MLDATHKKVIDGMHSAAYYWVGKNTAAGLFTAAPGGPFGMDHVDYLGWLYEGGGIELWTDFYQSTLKLNVIPFPAFPVSPQALGWFKRPLKSSADFKGMKCRQTGLNADLYKRLGQTVVNLPGGEIVPAAQRGVIDCAEWVGGIEDLKLGLPQVFKYHYTPGMHENNSIGEFVVNLDVLEEPDVAAAGGGEVGGQGRVPDLQHEVAAAERRCDGGNGEEARYRDPAHAARDPHRDAQGVGRDREGGVGEEPGVQARLRLAARVRCEGGAREALHVPAVLLRREPLLPGGEAGCAGCRGEVMPHPLRVPGENRMQARHLRWLIVGAAFVLGALGVSSRQLLGLAMPEMQSELGWSRSVISAAATLALLLLGFGGLYAGVMLTRFGRARLLGIGLTLVGIGMTASGIVHQSALFVVAFGLIAGAGFGLAAPAVLSTLVAPYFSTRRGLALGITAAGATLGPVLAIPLAAVAFETYGWSTGFVAAGFLCLALVPFVVVALRRAGPPPAAGPAAAPSLGTDFWRLMRSPVFHLLFWGFVACGFTSLGVIETHFIPYAAFCGFAPTTAANAFGVLSFFNLLGVVLAGWLSDRVNRPLLLAGIYGLRAITFLMLMNVGTDPGLLFQFALLFGLFDYASAPVVASLVASHLGLRVMGLAMGLIALGHQLGSALGALGGGVVFDLFNGYAGLWLVAFALAIMAGAMSIAIRPQTQPSA